MKSKFIRTIIITAMLILSSLSIIATPAHAVMSPSSGTFQSLKWTTPPTMEGPQPACTIVPYLPFCHLAYAPLNLVQTSDTKIGILCNDAYILDTASQCNGNGIPISYQTFRITINNLSLGETTVTIQATGTASNGQVSTENVFIYDA